MALIEPSSTPPDASAAQSLPPVEHPAEPRVKSFAESAAESSAKTEAKTGASEVCIYSDGSCLGNPGPGGYGVVLVWGKHRKELSGGFRRTTNNRMELLAAIKGLQALKRPCRVCLVSDSNYLRKGMTEWLANWKRNGWRAAQKKPVKNDDLWKMLDELSQRHRVRWNWVRGHSGHSENERCDELARLAAENQPEQVDEGYEQLHREEKAAGGIDDSAIDDATGADW